MAVGNVAPTSSIVAISDPRIEGTAITVVGSATDAGGSEDTLTYAWSVFKDGAATAYAGSSGVNQTSFTFTPDDDGSYQVVLTVSDEDGGSTTATQSIAVDNVLPAPQIVSIGTPRVEGTAIAVTGSATDPGGANDALTYSWQV